MLKLINCTVTILLLTYTSVIAQGTTNNTISADAVFKAIEKSYNDAIANLADKKIKIQSASVTFSVAKTVTTGGSIKILIVKIGRTHTKEKETTITFNLSKEPKSLLKAPPLDELGSIIVAAANEFYSIQPTSGLQPDDFEIEISFAITNDTSGGVEFTVLSADTELSRDMEKKVAHTIKLTLKKA